MFGNPFRLRSTLSATSLADHDDFLNAKRALGSLGYKSPDNNLFEGIRQFQSDHGLKQDGVMKPGGESERMLGKMLEKQREHSGTSLPDPRPTAMPGILPGGHDWTKRKAPDIAWPELPRQSPKQTRNIKKLLELIAKKARDNEVVAESARTVKAALKTSDHTDLAKFHAQAVRDHKDNALAEITEFGNQLKKANPEVFNSWFHIFKSERPEDAERMLLAGILGEDDLNGSGGNDSFKTNERIGLSEGTIGTSPRKPETSRQPDLKHQDSSTTLATDLADHPDFKGIDLEFVHNQEGKKLRTGLYIPKERKSGKVIGKSGATVGHGVDIGQMNSAELQRLGDQHDLPQGLIDKLKPYTGKIKDKAAAFLDANPLIISGDEARQLSVAKYTDTMVKLRRSADKHLKPHNDFDSLPGPVKTVVYDLAINYGPNFLDQHKRFRARLQEGILEGMIDELRNYDGPPELEGRRVNEAKELEKLLHSF